MRHWLPALLLVWQCAAAAAPAANRLAGHPSPYLAMHGRDPVAWQLWSPEVLERARREGKLVFVSSGYFSCHWCHVMQRESYRDADIAARLNRHFVAVKVDRELEPALDAQLIEFVELTRGRAGWPLNVFLTPEGYPLLGFTYLPPERFAALLDDLQQRWQTERESLTALAREGVEELRARKSLMDAGVPVDGDALRALADASRGLRDDLAGGFGQQARFPMAPQLSALLDAEAALGDEALAGFLVLTLDQMAGRGLRDHLGEGFFRYTTDPDWLVPHFEKMLYTSAQLSMLYLKAAQVLDRPRYRDIGLRTLDFVLDHMAAGDGAFLSSFSAVDDQGREGYYYLWSTADLERLLDQDELRAARAWWNLRGTPAFDYGYLPVAGRSRAEVAGELGMKPDRLERLLASAKRKLLAERGHRALPADGKRLAGWNGLVLSALARAWQAGGEPRYRRAGRALVAAIHKLFLVDGGLRRSAQGGRALGSAGAEDYALVARGLYDWSLVDESSAGAAVPGLVRRGWNDFYRGGRWYRSESSLVATLGGKLALESSPLPSASA
ncbi:MAG TPA: thioredoxin domain-containing protein, partial [Gammaproteobacteria bacterium]|nr:thioredoxin domain-containing protein [Gammaproteobacteria bacterium]